MQESTNTLGNITIASTKMAKSILS